MSKIKLFTHNDLDGVGCAVVGKVVFGEDIDIEHCGYKDVNEKIESFLNSNELREYSMIFITDLSINEKVAEMIDCKSNHTYQLISFNLLDHHKTAEWLNKYDWAYVESERDTQEGIYKLSGTTLFLEHLSNSYGPIENMTAIKGFVDAVRLYDTWEWKRLNLQFPKDLNDIYHLVGLNEFINTYTEKLSKSTSNFKLDPIHLSLLKYKRKETENYISKKIDQVKVIDRVAFIVADNNISELGNKICETVDCDYCAIYTGQSVSLRSIGDFDVSVIAKEKGGGGQKNASGYEVDKLENLFELVKPYTIDRKKQIEAEKLAKKERILAEKTAGYTAVQCEVYDKHSMKSDYPTYYLRNDITTDILHEKYFSNYDSLDEDFEKIIEKYGVDVVLYEDGDRIEI